MKLTPSQIDQKLKSLSGWTLNSSGEITKTYKFPGFARALLFVNSVGHLAETADHHPDVLVQFNKVTLSLSTHSEGGLTEKDFGLATKVDERLG